MQCWVTPAVRRRLCSDCLASSFNGPCSLVRGNKLALCAGKRHLLRTYLLTALHRCFRIRRACGAKVYMSENEETVVLVADDEPSTLALVAAHVRSKGFRVIEASDGDMAWQMAHQHLPDLVILDVMMPGMSGWEVCRKIRESLPLAHTGVVMLTGIGENLNEMTSPLYGADAHVDKPFEFSDLDDKIELAFRVRREGAFGRADGADEESLDMDDDDFEDEEPPDTVTSGKLSEAEAERLADEEGAEGKKASKKVTKKAAKKAAKKVTKKAAKKAAKKVTKKAAKKASKKVTKKTSKKAAKKVTKKASKKAAKKVTKKASKKASARRGK